MRIGKVAMDPQQRRLLDAISMRFEEALRGSGVSIDEIKAQALQERAEIVRKRYGHVLLQRRPKRRK